MATPQEDAFRNAFFRAIIKTALLLPYRARIAWAGWMTSWLVAPIAGWPKRIQTNLDHVLPDLTPARKRAIARRVSDNVGRTLIEIYSGQTFLDRIQNTEMLGPGLEAFQQAREANRPVILITGHIGNYDVIRGTLHRNGHTIAALYRPMENKAFNAHYVKAISTIASPVFPKGSKGLAQLVRHLRGGGIIGIVADVASRKAPVLEFFGKPAHTSLSAAELAIKFDAILIPAFGIRQPDGLSFQMHFAAPIPNTEPTAMMQNYNDTVEAYVRQHPEQWLWFHRRWKGYRTKFAVGEKP